MSAGELPERRHEPTPGVRIARICDECLTRKFGDPDWKCTCAGGRKTKDQPNQPYFGKSTS